MKQFLIGLIGGVLILSACGQVPAEDKPAATGTPVFVTPDVTATRSPIPTSTNTFLPTATLTESITPLPTIPTFTTTFDVSKIVSVTPARKAECPIEKADAKFVFNAKEYDPKFSTKLLNYLNSGGSIQSLIASYRKAYQWADDRSIQKKDVTGDGIPELLFTDWGFFTAYICNNGQYETKVLLGETYHFTQPSIINIKDMNRNGMVEIMTIEGDERVRIVSVLEWDGDDFQNLNRTCSTLYGPSWAEASDTNGDGMLELIMKQAIPIWSEYYEGLPWRKEKRTCAWDGEQFVLAKIELASPEYRFQATQDGDSATLQNEFKKALSFYQEAIGNNRLSSFSPEILQNLRANLESQLGPNPSPTPTPYPSDITEYPKLAAYAHYRIMLLHIVQGNAIDAGATYKALQEKFNSDPYGKTYVQMARAFWNAYQATHKMYDGCVAAIQYAAKHPEILIPLGSDYHGWQSHTYVPADVCPFR